MNDYDFSSLNDKEFEILANDLLSKHFNIKIDRFKPGPDQGIDGRFFSKNGISCILQYKHYLGSGINKLLYDLENNEVEKVRKLNPNRYIFATSLPLSAANKTKIKSIFHPFIKSESDIFGKENLNDLLKDYPDIEKTHYKLWLCSTTVLENILNRAINGRSLNYLEEIKGGAKLYVETEKHKDALKLLEKSNVLIITGEPGVGKTTLAESLCLFFCSREYQLCVIENSLNEAEAVYSHQNKSQKIVFYFDDFLGSNYLQALEQHQDTHITRFIQRVKTDGNKKFILTSRTNIFHRGISLSDKFKDKKIDNAEFVLSVNSLSDLDKARILYNHMWFKGLSIERINQIYLNKRYFKIINHKNYNPRLIEYITDNERLNSVDDKNYWDHIEKILNNPSEIWRTPFYVQSDQFIRRVVLLVVFNGRSIAEKDLIRAYNEMCRIEKTAQNTNLSKSFELVVKSAVGFFLNRSIVQEESVIYTPFNPTVSDFILEEYKEDLHKLSLIYCSLSSAQSLNTLNDLYKNNKIDEQIYQQVLLNLIETFSNQVIDNSCYDYFVCLVGLLKTNDLLSSGYYTSIKKVFEQIISNPKGLSILDGFVQILISMIDINLIAPIEKEKIHGILGLVDLYQEDISAAMQLIDYFDIDDETIIEKISELTHEYLYDILADECSGIDISEFIDGGDEYGPYVNEDRLVSEIDQLLQGLKDDLCISASIDIDDWSISSDIDKDKLISDFLSNVNDEWAYKGRGIGGNSDRDNIEDLFDRSGGR